MNYEVYDFEKVNSSLASSIIKSLLINTNDLMYKNMINTVYYHIGDNHEENQIYLTTLFKNKSTIFKNYIINLINQKEINKNKQLELIDSLDWLVYPDEDVSLSYFDKIVEELTN